MEIKDQDIFNNLEKILQNTNCEQHGKEYRHICTSSIQSDYILKPFCLQCYDKNIIQREMTFPREYLANLKKSLFDPHSNYQKKIQILELEEKGFQNQQKNDNDSLKEKIDNHNEEEIKQKEKESNPVEQMKSFDQKQQLKNEETNEGLNNYLNHIFKSIENIENVIEQLQEHIIQLKQNFHDQKILLQEFIQNNSYENVKKELMKEISLIDGNKKLTTCLEKLSSIRVNNYNAFPIDLNLIRLKNLQNYIQNIKPEFVDYKQLKELSVKLLNQNIIMTQDFNRHRWEQAQFVDIGDQGFKNIKLRVVNTLENFNQSIIIISIFHIENNNLVCLTQKNHKLILVFIDSSLQNPYNGEIDIDVIQVQGPKGNGRNFVRGKKNTFLFSINEAVLVIDYKEQKIIHQFNHQQVRKIYYFDSDPFDENIYWSSCYNISLKKHHVIEFNLEKIIQPQTILALNSHSNILQFCHINMQLMAITLYNAKCIQIWNKFSRSQTNQIQTGFEVNSLVYCFKRQILFYAGNNSCINKAIINDCEEIIVQIHPINLDDKSFQIIYNLFIIGDILVVSTDKGIQFFKIIADANDTLVYNQYIIGQFISEGQVFIPAIFHQNHKVNLIFADKNSRLVMVIQVKYL